ncbi:hypothetical protein [Deinococcus budaensis]|uniref:Uncharacterized protein n=1 Tax=Deinococcus budaensis TaxID=1665626 RepID=A0A7W8LQI0_9DEIO|nr:hypothetical protein [Deinococcus budaensis]MBB5234620.1 hypothetical protein [Deinococcus budaensis]
MTSAHPLNLSPHTGDPEREALWGHPRLLCAELSVSRRECVVLAVGME